MLSKEIRTALELHRRSGLFWDPRRGLNRVRALPGELETWIGERPDGTRELVRAGRGAGALQLLLNEAATAQQVDHSSLVRLIWSACTDDDELTLGFAWRKPRKLEFPLDLRWLLRSFTVLTRAVAALHDKGLLHGDLKDEAVSWAEDPEQLLLWDLRMAQAPGPRAWDAYTARFAAPERVTGGSLDPSSDVYAIGVMLYSLFIRDRFPSIVAPSQSSPAFDGASPRANQAFLSPITAFGMSESEAVDGPPVQQMMNMAPPPAPGGGSGGDQAILGAKVLFAAELERVISRNTDIVVAKELLGLVEKATAQKPADRFRDANALATALAQLLSLAEEL